jgi:tetratricopeptide (TPR) repeat protein
MKSRRLPWLASLLLIGALGAAPPTAPEHGIGNVHMDISCGADANARFDRGLALLHNFWYERALTEFDATIKAHPDCAMAYWGAAMTYNHPLCAAAFRAMDAAVAAEDALPRHLQPTFPPIPAHEMYGRMLLDADKYDVAAAQFTAALKLFPNRALAMLGAARALRGAGDRAGAARYAASFMAMWSNADAGRPELAEAVAVR